MTKKQQKMARHALGLPNNNNLSYRNHFCANKESPEYQEWEELVAKGLATKRLMGAEWCGDYFYLTPDGAKSVLLPHESISREDAEAMNR